MSDEAEVEVEGTEAEPADGDGGGEVIIEEVPVQGVPVSVFEGVPITQMDAILPRMVIEMPEGYQRGTHLRLNVEVRIKSVRLEEGRKGDLVRQHVLAIEGVELVSAFQPEQIRDDVGGSASASAQLPDEEEAQGLGITFERTGGLWRTA